ncbi:PD-(D/E)XK nuclease family protein [Candidatus Parcubacteria bacterium]|nr:MAG: PD-(D/E)XK nuclease family protein [Candidatus Parcubacteria bacterium]
MKRLHVIHNKFINNIDLVSKESAFKLLESETLEWAREYKYEAYQHTLPVQKEYWSNPTNEIESKYFKYLRRLLEHKLKHLEDIADITKGQHPELNAELSKILNIESMRILDFLSVSQIQMYKFCPRKYYYRYLKGIKFPKTHALHFGTCFDNTLNKYYDEKIKGNVLTRQALYTQFYEEFEKGREEVLWGETDPKQLIKIGPKVLDAYLEKFDAITNATDVQKECIIHLDNGGRVVGYIDILEASAIVDTKTANKPWETSGRYAKHLEELQPRAYSLWYLEEYEKVPKFRYQIVVKPKTTDVNPQTQLINVELKKYEIEGFRHYLQKIWDEIQVAIPNGKKAFPAQAEVGPLPGRGIGRAEPEILCTKEWCEYAGICESDGLKIPTKWISKTGNTPGHHVYE